MKSLILYLFKDYRRSNKYIAPLMIYIIIIACMYSIKPDYVMSSYAFTCIFLYAISAWIAFGFIDNESNVAQQLTILHIKRENTYYLIKVLCLLLIIFVLDLFTVFYPIIAGVFIRKVTISDIIVAILSHGIIGILGIAIGILFNSRLVTDRKLAILMLNLIVVISIVQKSLVQILPFLKWVSIVIPPAYLIIDKIGAIDYVNSQNLLHLTIALMTAAIYSVILVCIFIKSMRKRLF